MIWSMRNTSRFGVQDPDFWKHVQLYKMYFTLFFEKKIKITEVISVSQIFHF